MAIHADFLLERHGMIFLLQPLTGCARQWVREHSPEDAQLFGDTVIVEHRCIADIVQSVFKGGFVVKYTRCFDRYQ